MASSNPVLRPKTFNTTTYSGLPMTIQGTVNKTLFLLFLVVISATYAWYNYNLGKEEQILLAVFGASLLGLILALATTFKPDWSPVTAPMYSLVEGVVLGGISALMEAQYSGIVLQAVLLTLGILFSMLLAYKFRLVRATEKFRLVILAATGSIVLVYFITMILGLFQIHIPFIHQNGLIGIGFSLFVVIIASLNLILDFDTIEYGVSMGAPSYMEWYGAFGLMVTLIWLYLEVLRLLAKIMGRRD